VPGASATGAIASFVVFLVLAAAGLMIYKICVETNVYDFSEPLPQCTYFA